MAKGVKLVQVTRVLKQCIEDNIDPVLDALMDRFDDEIVAYEDREDPARPSICRAEFREFLKESILDNITISPRGEKIEIGVGDTRKLGFGEELDPETTDCLKIIGTVLQGIEGDYVLITSDMVGGDRVGRFGGAYLMPVDEYRRKARRSNWNPHKPIWSFSGFPGIPDFFEDVNLNPVLSKCVKKMAEAIKRLWRN
jgi:hypothetical protein